MKKTDEIARLLQWNAKGNAAFGVLNGYAFCVHDMYSAGLIVRALTANAASCEPDAVLAFVKEHRKAYHLYPKPVISGNVVQIQLSAFGTKPASVADFIRIFAQYLGNSGFSRDCCECGKAQAPCAFYQIDGTYSYLCETCAALASTQKENEIDQSGKGSTAWGLIGAFVGGLVGIVPWILLSMFNYIAAAGGIAIAWSAFYGYKLLNGKMNRRALIIASVVVVTILMTYVAVILSMCIAYAREMPVSSFLDLFAYVFVLPFVSAEAQVLWGDIGVAYLMSALGAASVIWSLNTRLKNRQKSVSRVA